MKQIGWRVCVFLLFLAATTIALVAQTFTTLVNFDGPNGVGPQAVALVQGTDGNLYGTTFSGGSSSGCEFEGCGTVFKMTAAGAVTTLYSFCVQAGCSDGSNPEAGLILATDGNFYGSTTVGGSNGYGTVFRVTPDGKLTTLHSFNLADGYRPIGNLTQAANGSFYGTTSNGGDVTCNSPYGCGTVFRITSQGAFTTLHIFKGQPDGDGPFSGLTLGSDGNLYGTTESGGATGFGLAYRTGYSREFLNRFNFLLYVVEYK